MSSGSRMVMPGARSAARVARRFASTDAGASSSSSSSAGPVPTSVPRILSRARRVISIDPSAPPIYASLLLSRPPLLQRTPSDFETKYHASTLALRHALSNPTPTAFYFRPGSLPFRRFVQRTHEYETATFGPAIAGKAPDVGDIPSEPEVIEVPRDQWATEDAARGEKSLERWPEDEIYCLVKDSGGKWLFPSTRVVDQEVLHEAVERLTGPDGYLDGKTMDTWLVTNKPIGVVRNGDERTFFLRSHILAGEPKLSSSSTWSEWAWLRASEVQERLQSQGDDALWRDIKGLFGIADDVESD